MYILIWSLEWSPVRFAPVAGAMTFCTPSHQHLPCFVALEEPPGPNKTQAENNQDVTHSKYSSDLLRILRISQNDTQINSAYQRTTRWLKALAHSWTTSVLSLKQSDAFWAERSSLNKQDIYDLVVSWFSCGSVVGGSTAWMPIPRLILRISRRPFTPRHIEAIFRLARLYSLRRGNSEAEQHDQQVKQQMSKVTLAASLDC
jgi:hypothetical protein